MSFYLSKVEILLCFVIYLLFLLYGIWNVYFIRNKIIAEAKHDFAQGWQLIGRPKDDSDDELETFKLFLIKNGYWFIVHMVVSEICRFKNKKLIPVTHCIIGILYIVFIPKIQSQLLIICLLFSFYIAMEFKSKKPTWILVGLWILVINFVIRNSSDMTEMETYEETYELIMIMSWSILKCSSFNFSYIESQDKHIKHKSPDITTDIYSVVNFIGYNLYFPTFVFGPFMLFERYIKVIENTQSNTTHEYWENLKHRLIKLVKDLTVVFLSGLLIEIACHFIYVYYLQHDIALVKYLSLSGLYGFGYLMGQFFHLHYTITYGFAIALSNFDKLNPPLRPKCIARIHFYSNMWKYFDQGLYEFLFKHIYASICTKTSSLERKSCSSIATFLFIFIWHGWCQYILIWTSLNFICLSLEKLFTYLTSTDKYQNFLNLHLSLRNQSRLYGFLGVHVFIPSAISNFYFFAGIEIGNYFMITTYTNGILHYFSLTIVCYCIFQCSQIVREWEIKQKLKSN